MELARASAHQVPLRKVTFILSTLKFASTVALAQRLALQELSFRENNPLTRNKKEDDL